jgi:hypothetical protein
VEAAQQLEKSARESVSISNMDMSALITGFNAKEADWAKEIEELDVR